MDLYRKTILQLIAARTPATDLKKASEAMGRNHAYLQQFITRGSPKYLGEHDRIKLAAHLGVDENELRPPGEIGRIKMAKSTLQAGDDEFVMVPAYDVRASAGNGSLVEQTNIIYHMSFRSEWLKRVTNAPIDKLAVISVVGDSMEPTLSPDDTVLVDTTKLHPNGDGIYVIAYDGMLYVKRIRIDPVRKMAQIVSDNPAYPPVENLKPDEVHVFGRVIWLGRRV